MIQDVLKLIEEKEGLKNKLETVGNELKDAVNNLDLNEFDNYDYESARHLYAQVQYLIDDERRKWLSDVVGAKKIFKISTVIKAYILSRN